jgi:hypothetical protein
MKSQTRDPALQIRTVAAVGLTMLALILAVPVARADVARTGDEPWYRQAPEAARQQALALFAQAVDKHQQLLRGDAKGLYEQALALWDNPDIRWNLALVLDDLGEYLRAHEQLERALRWEAALGAERLGEVRDRMQVLETQRLARLEASSAEPGAEITLDGQPWFRGAFAHQATAVELVGSCKAQRCDSNPSSSSYARAEREHGLAIGPVDMPVTCPATRWTRTADNLDGIDVICHRCAGWGLARLVQRRWPCRKTITRSRTRSTPRRRSRTSSTRRSASSRPMTPTPSSRRADPGSLVRRRSERLAQGAGSSHERATAGTMSRGLRVGSCRRSSKHG